MTARHPALALALAGVMMATSPAAGHQHTPAPAVVIPFELTHEHILVRARIAGDSVWLIVDTGSGLSSLDAEWAAAHGVRPAEGQAQVIGSGSVRASLAPVAAIALPGLELRDRTVVLIPFADVSRAHGRPIGGALGFDFLSQYVVEIDYTARRLTLRDPAGYEYAGRGTVVPVSLALRTPIVAATVTPRGAPPIPARLILDTGSASLGIRLTTPFVEAHPEVRAGGPLLDAPLGVGIGGWAFGHVTRLAEAHLGALVIPAPVAGLGKEKTGFFGVTFADGTIGAPVLSRTTLILDYARERVIVEPSPDFDRPYEYDMSGLTQVLDRRIHLRRRV